MRTNFRPGVPERCAYTVFWNAITEISRGGGGTKNTFLLRTQYTL